VSITAEGGRSSLTKTAATSGTGLPAEAKVFLPEDQIQKRVQELGKQISNDFRGRTVVALGVLENAFVFMADLVRAMDVPVICQFLKPVQQETNPGTLEIFFGPDVDVRGADVLLVEGVLHSGVTSDFLVRNLMARGAASVKLVTLLDRQAARRVALQPDYFGFLVDDSFLYGYGLGGPSLGRNLPCVVKKVAPGKP
jgi:hypoxanthine phosphoribosyltransferase